VSRQVKYLWRAMNARGIRKKEPLDTLLSLVSFIACATKLVHKAGYSRLWGLSPLSAFIAPLFVNLTLDVPLSSPTLWGWLAFSAITIPQILLWLFAFQRS